MGWIKKIFFTKLHGSLNYSKFCTNENHEIKFLNIKQKFDLKIQAIKDLLPKKSESTIFAIIEVRNVEVVRSYVKK